jgi:hypothetical protein
MQAPEPAEAARGRRPQGLRGSLDELSLRASLIAICAPVAVVLLRLATGYSPGGDNRGDIPDPVLAIAIASFILVPMLALTGAATALVVMAATLWSRDDRSWRAVFLLSVGASAMATAVLYDIVVIPEITAR